MRWTLPLPRTAVGIAVGAALTIAFAVALLPIRDDVDPATPTAVLILPIVIAASVGGLVAALVTAAIAGLALNLLFLPVYGTLKVRAIEDGIGLAAFFAVAVIAGLLVSNVDRRRRESEQRARALKELADERSVLLVEARRANELARLHDERTALLRWVSHDLRTPLSAIRAIAGDLRDGVAYDDATREELLGLVADEADRLDRMVANLLSMSRIEAGGRPEPTTVDLDDVVHSRVQALQAVLAPFTVQVRVPPDLPFVRADELQLEQVLTNLLANAARHSPRGSDLWIVATVDRAEPDMVRIEVSDRGPGIPPEDRRRVFEPFERGPDSRGSGIGLAICQAVVEGHGGRIWIEDRFGGGMTVAFTLPSVPRAAEVHR